MALPPIISNLPFMKLFRQDADRSDALSQENGDAAVTRKTGGPRDTLDISAAGLRTLVGARSLSAENEGEVRAVAAQARELLAQEQAVLGLDPRFT